MTHNHKVLVGMSGGVDSSVAVLLLKQQGYEVIGAFIKNWSDKVGRKQLCWVDDRRDAMRVAAKLNIPFVTFDFEPEFRKYVVDYLYDEYDAGRTPNPDIMCNKWIKFPLLLREAKKLGAEYVATGHYVRAQEHKSTRAQEQIYELYKAKDLTKDQSYFLYMLDQKILKHCLFPLGDLTKQEVRRIAEENQLPTAKKPDSQGICFIGEMKMKNFLRQRLPDKPGQIKTVAGRIIGKHHGLHYYTIGQRQGIGVGGRTGESNGPLYVVSKDLQANTLFVGPADSSGLFTKKAALKGVHWINPHPRTISAELYGTSLNPLPVFRGRKGGGQLLSFSKREGGGYQQIKLAVKIRYRAPDAPAKLDFKNGRYSLYFDKPERAVTPGQSAVFYDGEKMLGGGVIS